MTDPQHMDAALDTLSSQFSGLASAITQARADLARLHELAADPHLAEMRRQSELMERLVVAVEGIGKAVVMGPGRA